MNPKAAVVISNNALGMAIVKNSIIKTTAISVFKIHLPDVENGRSFLAALW